MNFIKKIVKVYFIEMNKNIKRCINIRLPYRGGNVMSNPKVVLAYSGGLDTSVAINWIKDQGYDVDQLKAVSCLQSYQSVLEKLSRSS